MKKMVAIHPWLQFVFSPFSAANGKKSGTSLFFLSLAGILLLSTSVLALDAPNGPGVASVWAPAAKKFIGTSIKGDSKVYFTGAEGILTEIYYPTPDRIQNVDLQFLVTDANKTWGDEEKLQHDHKVSIIDKRAMAWLVETLADSGKWRITKKIFADPLRSSVIQRVTFETLEAGKKVSDYNIYLLNNPAINNSGGGGENQRGPDNSRTLSLGGHLMLVASEPGSTSSALAISLPWKMIGGRPMVSNGFVGRNDGYTDLFGGAHDRTMDWAFDGAYDGNAAQMGWVGIPASAAASISFDVVLAFGGNEQEAMQSAENTVNSNLDGLETIYRAEWNAYANSLDPQNGLADDQYYLAAMALKSIQDKTNGAMIAAASVPWGETSGDGNQGGYHLVWARDLFKFASSLVAAGDTTSANRAVDYLFTTQMQQTVSDNPYSRPGRFPQNSFVDGTTYWNGTQMDETAMPIILAWKLDRTDLWPKIKLAAEFLAHNGPRTDQERWEEMAGYSPSTIAAEVAGLVCAADLAKRVGDPEAAKFYLKKADEWRNNVAAWTFTSTGFHGNKQYYIRISANQNPDDHMILTYGNGAGSHDQRYIIDGGFLELVRMGVMSPKDWTILETLPEYDAILQQNIPGKGPAWFRYNYDGYGEHNDGRNYDGSGQGRLWPIFTAERGIYEIARSGNGALGQPYQQALKAFSAETGFIPEQVWNITADITGWQTTTPSGYTAGMATKSAQPLSWAMGEYLNLVAAINKSKSDAPAVVCQRYACDKPQTTVTFNVNAVTKWGENIYLVGNNPLLSNWETDSGIKMSSENYPVWSVTVSLPASANYEYKFFRRDSNGAIIWESGNNRIFNTPASGNIVREDLFQ